MGDVTLMNKQKAVTLLELLRERAEKGHGDDEKNCQLCWVLAKVDKFLAEVRVD